MLSINHSLTIQSLTSDRTLSKLKTPRLSQEEMNKLLTKSKLRYSAEIRELIYDHKVRHVNKLK